MNKNYFKGYVSVLLMFIAMLHAGAQATYVGNGSILHFNGDILSDQVIVPDASATINQTAIATFTGSGYVDGTINVIGAGTVTVPVGDGAVKSTVSITTLDATDIVATSYVAAAPTGTMDASISTYALSDAEYWTVTSLSGTSTDVAVSGLGNTATTYGGNAPTGAPILVRRDNPSSNWVAYSSSPGFGEFAYAAQNATLNTNELEISNLSFYPNPLKLIDKAMYFNLPENVQQLTVSLYDVNGKLVRRFTNVPVVQGLNSIDRPSVQSGMYMVNFSFNNGAQSVTKRVLIN